MKLKVKCIKSKDDLERINRLLEEIDFEDDSKKMAKLIDELDAREDDNIGLFSIDLNDTYNVTIDVASGSSNYYDNIVIWEKDETGAYNEVACLDCGYGIGDLELSKEEFEFLDDDYMIKIKEVEE